MKKIALVLLFTLIYVSSAYAENWVLITDDKNLSVYIDKESIQKSSSEKETYSFCEKSIFKKTGSSLTRWRAINYIDLSWTVSKWLYTSNGESREHTNEKVVWEKLDPDKDKYAYKDIMILYNFFKERELS